MTYEIGKWYRVPAVYGQMWNYKSRYWPVMGPKHEDAEIVGFKPLHYHLDWRFVPTFAFRSALRGHYLGSMNVYSYVLHESKSIRWPTWNQQLDQPELRRMQCLRCMPTYPEAAVRKRWLTALEVTYAMCRLKPGMVCPHRGIPLDTLPVVDGIVTCPGHGLRWKVATGALCWAGSPDKEEAK